jgi:glycosyltransferase involved in cell wall biosynthesis
VQGATLLACNSIYSAERILASYGRSAEIVSLGVDDQVFMRRSSRPSDTTPSVIAVGGLEGFKNQRMIVEALGLMHADRRPRLVLVYERCDPVYRDAVLARAAQLGVKVEEHRGIADDHLAELYSIAAATVLAAQLEPLGLTALESIACGTPVVAVREAGYRETVTEGLNGLLVPRSARALAEGVAHVISGQAGLAKPRDLPGTILPHWSTRASVARQLRLLERTAGA